MRRREFLGVGGALFASSVFAPSVFAKGNFTTIYTAPALPSVIIAVATIQGELAKQKNIDMKIWRSPDQLRAGVASGEFKVMMSPSNVGVNLYNKGQNIAMLNILTNGIVGLVTKDESITHISRLEGKKIIIPFKNDMPDITFKAICKKLKVDISKIDITYTATPPEAIGMFLSKDFDAALTGEPMSSVAILKGKKMGVKVFKGPKILDAWKEAFGYNTIPQAGIIVNRDFYEANKSDFEILNSDLKNALSWIQSNRASASEIISNYLPAPVPAIENSFDDANLTVSKAKNIKDELMAFYEILIEFNPDLLGGKLPSENFFL